ncbi:hypothetical protein SHIRM173S_06262 [Streptomyces hirsutus]
MGPADGLLTCAKAVPTAAAGNADRAAGTLVSLTRPAGDAGLGENVDDAVLAGCPDVLDRTGRELSHDQTEQLPIDNCLLLQEIKRRHNSKDQRLAAIRSRGGERHQSTPACLLDMAQERRPDISFWLG